MSLKKDVWNVPNQISLIRLLISFVVFALIPLQLYWLALGLFILAAGTDWIDGWYARKFNQVTQLGRILDPFCDKILICGAYILLAVEMNQGFPWYAKIAGWMAVVVVARELLVTVLRSLIEGAGGDFSAKFAGKLKMVFQSVAVGSCLVALAMADPPTTTTAITAISGQQESSRFDSLPAWLSWTVVISVWLSFLSTVHSGYLYLLIAGNSDNPPVNEP